MGRPKKQSDSEVLLKAFEVISREGFESFTFEQVAKATGLSPAALVKRFKSKKRLAQLARDEKWDQNLSLMDAEAIEEFKGLQGIYSFLRVIARSVDSKRLGEHARWLGTEADDPRSSRKVAAYFATTRSIFKRLLEEAIEKHELSKEIDPADFAITLEALVQGSIFQFAFLKGRSVENHFKERFQSALRPYIL